MRVLLPSLDCELVEHNVSIRRVGKSRACGYPEAAQLPPSHCAPNGERAHKRETPGPDATEVEPRPPQHLEPESAVNSPCDKPARDNESSRVHDRDLERQTGVVDDGDGRLAPGRRSLLAKAQ